MPPQAPAQGQGHVSTPEEIITAVAKREGLDPRLALSVAQIESAMGRNAGPSTAGAIGWMQVMPETAKRHGQDPNDPLGNVVAGVRELKQLRDTYQGNIPLIFRRYNGSPTAAVADTDPYVAKTMAEFRRRAGLPPAKPGEDTDGRMVAALQEQVQQQAQQPGGSQVGQPPPNMLQLWGEGAPSFGDRWDYMMRGQGLSDIGSSIRERWGRVRSGEAPASAGRYFKEALASFNPVAIAEGVKSLVTTDPRETAKGIYEAHAQPVREGYYEGAVPLLGPRLAESHKLAEAGEYDRALGALTDVGLQVFGPGGMARAGQMRVIPRLFPPRLTRPQAEAVAFGKAHNIPVDVATASGSPFALKLQRAAEATPSGSPHGERARLARAERFPEVGEQMAAGTHPTPVTPLQAGEATQRGVKANIAARHAEADVAYDAFRQIEADPRYTQTVQVGTKTTTSPILGPGGVPVTQTVPVMKAMQLPGNLRAAKVALRPIYNELRRQIPLAKRRLSDGYTALENIVKGEDWAPVSQIERDLGAVKAAARGADLPQLRSLSQGLAAQAVKALEDVVDTALQPTGAAGRTALDAGRAATKAKHLAGRVLKQLQKEPVRVYGQLTAAKDSAINLLREVRQLAPTELPKIGRAYLEDLFATASGAGGWDKVGTIAAKWRSLGPETRQMLFGAAAPEWDKFFHLGEMLARTPNPSGTALTLTGIGSLLDAWRSPVTGGSTLLAAGKIAKAFNDPKWVHRLTEGLTIPAGIPRAAAWGTLLMEELGQQGETEPEPGPQAGGPPEPPSTGLSTPPPPPGLHLTIRGRPSS